MPPALLLLLAGIGGFADAGSFILVSSFTGHVTGNVVLAMVDLATGAWRQAGLCLLAVLGFAAGTFAAELWQKRRKEGRRAGIAVPLAAQIVLAAAAIAAYARTHPGGELVFIGCLCPALGLQNGALRQVGGTGLHTTYVTGVSTSLIGSLVAGRADDRAPALLGGVIVSFVAGALAGGLLTARFGLAGFTAIFAPMAAALALAALRGRPDDQKSRSA